MRFTLSINQVKCQEWKLTMSQGALFDLINQSSAWAKPHVINEEVYYWISRNKVLDEIPVAYSKPDTVYRALKDLSDKGLIDYRKEGKKDLVKLTEKGMTWNVKGTIEGDLKLGNKSEVTQNSEINPSKLGNKSELLPKNSDLNPTDKNTNIHKNTNNNINVQFDQFWDLYDKKRSRKKCEKKWLKLKDSEREAIMNHLPAYVESTPDVQYRKDPYTYLNNNSWEDEIIYSTPVTNNYQNGASNEQSNEFNELEQFINNYGTEQNIRDVS